MKQFLDSPLLGRYKTFYGRKFMNFYTKLERFSLASLSSLVYCLWVKLEPTQVKELLDSPL